MSKMNDYDALRKKNIAERNAVFAEFFSDLKKQKSELKELKKKEQAEEDQDENSENQPPRKRRRTVTGASGTDTPVARRRHVKLEFRKKYNTRSRARKSMGNPDQEEEEQNERRSGNKSKLRVLFPWAKPFQREIDLMKMGVCDVDEEEEEQRDDDSEDESERYAGQRRVFKVNKNPYDPETIPSVDEITEEMLANVAEKSSLKTYCKMSGTSCHQCRQKTVDTKTVCRSGECIGVRGQFCGPCLRGRYGESAVEALKDPDWACPPCRGLCNCSICRTRSGLRPTGILAPLAQEEGFQSVKDYLQSAELDET